MLIYVRREEALCLVKQVMQALPRKSTIKELEGIHMEADANRSILTLTATNLEITIRATLYAAVERSGSAVLPARFLADALSRFAGEEVGLELDEAGQCTLRSDRARYQIQALPGGKYPMPELPFPEDDRAFDSRPLFERSGVHLQGQ